MATTPSLNGGFYEVQVTDRGGYPIIGTLEHITFLRWSRRRDDISQAEVRLDELGDDLCRILGTIKGGRYELRIIRNGVPVWEGPITYKAVKRTGAVLHARDVLWYASRRVLEKGYDYSAKEGVSYAASAIDMLDDALRTVYDPVDGDRYGYNARVTPIFSTDDGRTAALIPAYSRKVWDLLDSYADDGGVDYTVVGRQIMFWDTHCRVAETVGLSDGDFNDDLEVIEYASDLRTRSWFTSNDGVATYAEAPQEWLDYYGPIDSLSTNIEEGGSGLNDVDIPIVAEKAERDLTSGYPAPVWVKVPENAVLNPDAPVRLVDLIPGTHIPVSSTVTCVPVTQVQKLDTLTVSVTSQGEVVQVSLSPRPAVVVERAAQAWTAWGKGRALGAEREVPLTLAQAGLASGTGVAHGPDVTVQARPQMATGTGRARAPSAVTQSEPGTGYPGVASGTGAALDATADTGTQPLYPGEAVYPGETQYPRG